MGFILIAGFGNVGKHIKNEFADAEIYDKFREEYKQLKNEKYDFCFVCVPTEFVNGKIETSAVENVLQEVDAEIYIIKSAVPIGFCSSVENKNIVYSPEFWGNTQHAKQEPDFLILSGSRKNTEKVAILYYTIKNGYFKIRFTDFKTAEFVKYAENSYLGLQVTIFAEFADICEQLDISFPEFRELLLLDDRISPSHTLINPETPYYNSHCLNKDIPGLLQQVNAPLLKAMHEINTKLKC